MIKKTVRNPIINIAIVVATAFFATACSEQASNTKQPPTEAQAITVTTHTLASSDWQGEIHTFGVIEAAEEIRLSLDFSGVIKTVLVNEGQKVNKGQLLIELDQEKRQLRFRQASENAIQAKAALDEAYLLLERRKALAEKKTVSREALDNAELALNRAQASYREAIAAQQLAKRELNDSKVYSPANGVIDVKSVEPGENIQAGSSLLTLQAVDTLRVQTWVSEKDVHLIRNGATARIELSGLRGKTFNGTVESVGVNADPNTGNFPVKLIIDPGSDFIRPGMTASVSLHGLTLSNMLILPEQALVDRDRRRVVFVVDTSTTPAVAQRREPLLSAGLNNQLFILSGLSEGEQLIMSSLDNIIDGSPLTIAN